MSNDHSNPDITVRGGIINVPASAAPTRPPRHQPDTPRTKKRTKTRPDHTIPDENHPHPLKDSPPTATAPPVPPPDEPAADSPD